MTDRPMLSPRKALWSSGIEKTPSVLKIDSLRAVTDEQAAHLPQTICLAPAGGVVFLGDCTGEQRGTWSPGWRLTLPVPKEGVRGSILMDLEPSKD